MEVFKYGKLLSGKLLRRINRFVCEVSITSLHPFNVLCYMANPGSMLGMCIKDAEVRISEANPGLKRKFAYSVEAINIRGTWIGCNTSLANKVFSAMLRERSETISGLLGPYDTIRTEVNYGDSRVDFMLEDSVTCSQILIEVKTVTMASDWFDVENSHERADKPFHRLPVSRPDECVYDGFEKVALFPDCESKRALRHVLNLSKGLSRSMRTALVYMIMRDDTISVAPSLFCDPGYTAAVHDAIRSGVECFGLQMRLDMADPDGGRILFSRVIPVEGSIQEHAAGTCEGRNCTKRQRPCQNV
jgi:sugar fermentation stimulation protein A